MSLYAADDSNEVRFRDGEERPEEPELCGCGAPAVTYLHDARAYACTHCLAEYHETHRPPSPLTWNEAAE